jgi:hypothetical protein
MLSQRRASTPDGAEAAARSAAPNVVSADGRYGVRDGAGFGGAVGRFAASGIIGAEVELIGDPFDDGVARG